ncbi:MAG: HAD-IA family hydrolase [Candidatus Lokiarchaeota archaeon]|nr:HAD-IA family hydrolase [Candidatus Lokiarchaeota archaeon]
MENLNLDNYRGVIFDLDGVIYNIINAVKKAVEDVIKKYNLNIDINTVLEEIAHLIEEIQHYPVPKIILKSYDLLKLDFLKEISYMKKVRIAIFLFNQFNEYRKDSGLFEGIEEIIKQLYKKNINLAILTNNQRTYAEEVLEKYNLNKYFKTLIGFNEVSKVKPNPEGLVKIMKTWNLDPDEVIFIGDMTTDIQAGKAAEVTMVCVASGLAKSSDLKEYKPNYLVNNTEELKQLFNL